MILHCSPRGSIEVYRIGRMLDSGLPETSRLMKIVRMLCLSNREFLQTFHRSGAFFHPYGIARKRIYPMTVSYGRWYRFVVGGKAFESNSSGNESEPISNRPHVPCTVERTRRISYHGSRIPMKETGAKDSLYDDPEKMVLVEIFD